MDKDKGIGHISLKGEYASIPRFIKADSMILHFWTHYQSQNRYFLWVQIGAKKGEKCLAISPHLFYTFLGRIHERNGGISEKWKSSFV